MVIHTFLGLFFFFFIETEINSIINLIVFFYINEQIDEFCDCFKTDLELGSVHCVITWHWSEGGGRNPVSWGLFRSLVFSGSLEEILE